MANQIVGDSVVIPLEVFRARQACADSLPAAERQGARRLLSEFNVELVACPTARREGAVAASTDSSPLRPEEVRQLRTVMAQFAAIREGCPIARRLCEGA